MLGLAEGVLIYCQHTGTAIDREVVVRRSGHRLRTYPLDLRGARADIERAISDLADHLATR